MRNWEDTVKNRLENYRSAPPEACFAEFKQRREVIIAAPKKGVPIVWALAAAAAVVIALVLLNRPDGAPMAPDVDPSSSLLVAMNDSSDYQVDIVTVQPETSIAVVHENKKIVAQAHPTEMITPQKIEERTITSIADSNESLNESPEKDVTAVEAFSNPSLPSYDYSPEKVGLQSSLKTKTAYKESAFTALASAAALSLIPLLLSTDNETASGSTSTGFGIPGEGIPADEIHHFFPLKTGLLFSFPISDHLSLTTGMHYSLYKSVFSWTDFLTVNQFVHYLGIPLKVDATIVSSRLFDFYLGGGMELDQCVYNMSRQVKGPSINTVTKNKKGDPVLSLLGGCGLQFNIIKHSGLFLQPELSWDIPFGEDHPITYRTDHPLTLSLSYGLRIVF